MSSFHRRKLLKDLKKSSSAERYSFFEKIVGQVWALADKRNWAAHGIWGTSPTYPEHLLRQSVDEAIHRVAGRTAASFVGYKTLGELSQAVTGTAFELVSEADLKEVWSVIRDMNTELGEAVEAFYAPYFSQLRQALNPDHELG